MKETCCLLTLALATMLGGCGTIDSTTDELCVAPGAVFKNVDENSWIAVVTVTEDGMARIALTLDGVDGLHYAWTTSSNLAVTLSTHWVDSKIRWDGELVLGPPPPSRDDLSDVLLGEVGIDGSVVLVASFDDERYLQYVNRRWVDRPEDPRDDDK